MISCQISKFENLMKRKHKTFLDGESTFIRIPQHFFATSLLFRITLIRTWIIWKMSKMKSYEVWSLDILNIFTPNSLEHYRKWNRYFIKMQFGITSVWKLRYEPVSGLLNVANINEFLKGNKKQPELLLQSHIDVCNFSSV